MKRRLIHTWSGDGLPTLGSEVAYDAISEKSGFLPALPQWAWDAILISDVFCAIREAGDELGAACAAVFSAGGRP